MVDKAVKLVEWEQLTEQVAGEAAERAAEEANEEVIVEREVELFEDSDTDEGKLVIF